MCDMSAGLAAGGMLLETIGSGGGLFDKQLSKTVYNPAGTAMASIAASGGETDYAFKMAEADDVKLRQDIDVMRIRRDLARTLGAQRVAYGASGVRNDQGTPMAVAQESISEAMLDQAITEHQADLDTWRIKMDADQLRQDAWNQSAEYAAGAYSKLYGIDNTGSTVGSILGAAGKIASGSAGLFKKTKAKSPTSPFGGTQKWGQSIGGFRVKYK